MLLIFSQIIFCFFLKRFSDYCNLDASEDFSAFLKEGETALPCSYNSKVFENCRSHVFME